MSIAEFLRGWRAEIAVEDAGSMPAASFADAAAREAGGGPHAIFLSGSEHECSRRSIALLLPAAILRVKNGDATLHTAAGRQRERTDPFDLLTAAREGLRNCRDVTLPPAVGGYIAYDAAHAIEDFPANAEDTLALPDLLFFWPTRMLFFDHATARVQRCTLRWRRNESMLPAVPIEADASRTSDAGPETDRGTGTGVLRRSFSRLDYEAAVSRVRRHIFDGDVYQVNLSQRFSFPLTQPPHALWQRLFDANPAPFYAYVDGGDHQVLSTSMERLLRIDPDATAGDRIETRPIKGTRPRGKSPAEDAAREQELRTSVKDDAELSMIVDLARNDIGRVCRPGSVRVREHKRV